MPKLTLLALLLLIPVNLSAQSMEAGASVSIAHSREFDENDVGIGGRLGWRVSPVIGLEGEATLYPREYPGGISISRRRIEGLFGATVGPRLGAFRPFARARAGFLNFAEAPGPIACVAIFPPPLSCVLAAGKTMPAYDVGGGVEFAATDRTLVRIDMGDRMVRYPGPSLTRGRRVTDGVYGHDFRFAFGGGVKF